MKATFAWTEEHVAALRKCVDEGLSAGLTAAHFRWLFQTNITRNAIIGKAIRLKLRWHNAPFNQGGAPMKGRQQPARKPQVSLPFKGLPPKPEPFDVRRAIAATSNSRPVDLVGLTNRTCRWPLWGDAPDEPRLFCGALEADNTEGRPYCPEHAAASVGRTYTRPDRIAAGPLGRRNVLPSRIALDKASE